MKRREGFCGSPAQPRDRDVGWFEEVDPAGVVAKLQAQRGVDGHGPDVDGDKVGDGEAVPLWAGCQDPVEADLSYLADAELSVVRRLELDTSSVEGGFESGPKTGAVVAFSQSRSPHVTQGSIFAWGEADLGIILHARFYLLRSLVSKNPPKRSSCGPHTQARPPKKEIYGQ